MMTFSVYYNVIICLDDNMIPIPNNTDVVCYYVTKHSWRGKYVIIILYKKI